MKTFLREIALPAMIAELIFGAIFVVCVGGLVIGFGG